MALLLQSLNDQSMDVLVCEDNHRPAAVTTLSARSASMAYWMAASTPSRVSRG